MCIASVNVNTSTITEKEEVKSKLLSFDGVKYYVWSVCYTDDGQANKIYHSTVPSPNSSSISSPSSNSFRNRAWSCSLFFFCQYLYAATTPRTNTVETRALINMTTARCVSFLFLWGFEAELESIDKWKQTHEYTFEQRAVCTETSTSRGTCRSHTDGFIKHPQGMSLVYPIKRIPWRLDNLKNF